MMPGQAAVAGRAMAAGEAVVGARLLVLFAEAVGQAERGPVRGDSPAAPARGQGQLALAAEHL
jgi:hypothetical protein